MADPSSSSTSSTSHSSSSTSISSSGGVALRSSCNACTDAKIGCTKEKPCCARCERRGEECHYSPIRRLGRRPSKPATALGRVVDSPPSDLDDTQHTSSAQHVVPTAMMLSHPSPDLSRLPPDAFQNIGFSSNFNDLFSDKTSSGRRNASVPTVPIGSGSYGDLSLLSPQSLTDEMWSGVLDAESSMAWEPTANPSTFATSTTTDSNMDFDAFLAEQLSRYDGTTTEASTVISAPQTGSPQFDIDWLSSALPTTEAAPSSSRASTDFALQDANATTQQALPRRRIDSTIAGCDCFDRCLILLRRLRPQSTEEFSTPLSFETVMAQNNHALAAVSRMLECQATHDASVVSFLPVLVFFILGWYAAAAASTMSGPMGDAGCLFSYNLIKGIVNPPTDSTLANFAPGEKASSAVGQMILEKACIVRRIVNQLSTHLQVVAARVHAAAPAPTNAGHSMAALAHELLFNGTMPDITRGDMARVIEANLRARLRELCHSVMGMLLEK